MHYQSLYQKTCWAYNYYGAWNLFKIACIMLNLFCQGKLNKDHKHQQVEQVRYRKMLKASDVKNGLIEVNYLNFKLKLSVDDPGLAKDILVNSIRERISTLFLNRFLKGNMTIFEIGANQGAYLLQEATRTSKDSKIYAFEPSVKNTTILKENIKLNNVGSKIEVIECAVSDRTGKRMLFNSKASNWNYLVNENKMQDFEKGNTSDVDTITIDSFCKERKINNIDLIRMDIEGHELAAINGGRNILKSSKNCMIFMEFHPDCMRSAGSNPVELLEILKATGFYCFAIISYGSLRPFYKKLSWVHLISELPDSLSKYPSHMFFKKV